MAEKQIFPKLSKPEERLLARNREIAVLRERSGLSMDDLAKEMGYKGQSSIQRYLSPDYDRGFRPELVARFKAALVGRGDPPITPNDLSILDSWAETKEGETLDLLGMFADEFIAVETGATDLEKLGTAEASYRKKLEAMGLYRRDIASVLSQLRRSRTLGAQDNARVVALPF